MTEKLTRDEMYQRVIASGPKYLPTLGPERARKVFGVVLEAHLAALASNSDPVAGQKSAVRSATRALRELVERDSVPSWVVTEARAISKLVYGVMLQVAMDNDGKAKAHLTSMADEMLHEMGHRVPARETLH